MLRRTAPRRLACAALSVGFLVPSFARAQEPSSVTLVDRETGRGIEGAFVLVTTERPCPSSGELWFHTRATADESGFASLPPADQLGADNGGRWFFFDAPGYVPQAEHARIPNERVELERGADVPLMLVDPFGDPLPGVSIGWMIGCGHTPDIRNAVSDEDGLAVLRDANPRRGDLWPVGAGVLSDYAALEWSADGASGVVHCDPGVTLRGTLLDTGGRPAAGMFVGQPHRHRGPWTEVAADGTFELHGLELGEVLVHDSDGEFVRWAPGPAPGVRRVALSTAEDEEAPKRHLTVACLEGGSPRADVSVWAVRPRDGWNVLASTDDDGRADFELTEGDWVVHVGDPLGAVIPRTLPVPGALERLDVEIRSRPTIAVDASELPAKARVLLATAEAQRDVTRELGEPLALPEERCVLRVLFEGRVRRYVVSEADRRAGRLRLGD